MTNAMIHVVDDDASVRESLCRVLELSGFSVRAHASAGDFLMEWPSNDTPGCVLLDVRMAGLSGLAMIWLVMPETRRTALTQGDKAFR